jgi:GNAT superfamily N-acetyltransferase
MQITVRQATIGDLDLIAPLFDLLERFQHNEAVIFLALDEAGTAVGFVQLFPSFSSGAAASILVLNDLFIVPAARRTGVGKLLMQAAADYGKAVGAVRMTLSTEVTNTTAQALYEAEGWKRQTDFYVYNLALTI